MNQTDQNNYENSLLAMLGKALWNYLIIKILNENKLGIYSSTISQTVMQ